MLIASVADFNNWKEDFIKYVENNGRKTSTAKDYAGRIEKILQEENMAVTQLVVEVDRWITEYKTGKYEDINKKRHNAPSRALEYFKAFADAQRKPYVQNYSDLAEFLGKKPTDILF